MGLCPGDSVKSVMQDAIQASALGQAGPLLPRPRELTAGRWVGRGPQRAQARHLLLSVCLSVSPTSVLQEAEAAHPREDGVEVLRAAV